MPPKLIVDAVFAEGVGVGGAAGGIGSGEVGVFIEFFDFGTLVDFSVGVAEFDGDVTNHFVLEADGLDAGDGFHDGGLGGGGGGELVMVMFERKRRRRRTTTTTMSL